VKKPAVKNVAASVRERLYQLAARRNEDFALILTRYALERLLYRLSFSGHRDRLVLKGAMLFHAWTESPHRPTRDLDLLGFGEPSQDRCREMLREICTIPDAGDGLTFALDSLAAEAIKEDDIYHGVRIRLTANLAQARIPIQIDIGFGDFLSPAPQDIDYPTLLEMPAPRIRAYSMESVVAEKIEAMVSLGLLNSRMKDFYDVWFLARTFTFEAEMLRAAIDGTFARRQTTWSNESISVLFAELTSSSAKQIQWRAFVTRNRLQAPEEFGSILESIHVFATLPTTSQKRWSPGGQWAQVSE
jgi:predicted nucleotidyltransferase component of viral defense system